MRLLLTVVLALAVLPPTESLAQQVSAVNATMFMVHRDSIVYRLGDGALQEVSTLNRGTAVAGVRFASLRTENGASEFWEIVPMTKGSPTGWVKAMNLKRFDDYASDARKGFLTSRVRSLPELINLQKDDSLKSAWQQVQTAIVENEALPEGDRIPEPYFARAEIWCAVNNYGNAVQDYLTAIKYVRSAGRDLASFSAYLEKLDVAIQNFEKIPTTPTLGSNTSFLVAAKDHFIHGYHAFWRGDYKSALDRFDNAVQCNPREAKYWYYRALTFKQMGNEGRAQADALLGAKVEQRGAGVRKPLDVSFSRVQGDLRQWLEGFRVGDPSHRILQLAAEGVFIMNSKP
jgi:tetratricopeptide (TPR) repeat protein